MRRSTWRRASPPRAPTSAASRSSRTTSRSRRTCRPTYTVRALDERCFLIDSATDKTRRNDEVAPDHGDGPGVVQERTRGHGAPRSGGDLIGALPPQTPTPPGPARTTRSCPTTRSASWRAPRRTSPRSAASPTRARPQYPGRARPPRPRLDPNAHPTTSAFTDTLDGRAANRYFYRTSYVDAAQNASKQLRPLDAACILPVTALPHPVQFTRVLGDDREIVLVWPDLADPGITSYRLFRTRDENATANIRTMDRFPNTVAAGSGKNGQITLHRFRRAAVGGLLLSVGVDRPDRCRIGTVRGRPHTCFQIGSSAPPGVVVGPAPDGACSRLSDHLGRGGRPRESWCKEGRSVARGGRRSAVAGSPPGPRPWTTRRSKPASNTSIGCVVAMRRGSRPTSAKRS